MEEIVYEYLQNLRIHFKKYEHPAVNTVAEAEIHWKDIKGTHCKNLFFRDPKGRKHYLLITPFRKDLDIREFAVKIQSGRLSFASEKRLYKYLGLKPGSVSPFGLINDTENHVMVYLDADLAKADYLGFHPNINTRTILIAKKDFEFYLNNVGNPWVYLED